MPGVKTIKLSAAIITFNEENNIKACIDSFIDIVDEVVVVDSFSSDKTREICLSYPQVTFTQQPFEGHIQQKNRAIELCTGDWILALDADERVSSELKAAILGFFESGPKDDCVGVKFPRLTCHLNRAIRHSGWYPNARFRLFKKGFARWGGENPHDKIILTGQGRRIQGDLLHYSFTDLAHQMQTVNTFSSIAAYTRYGRGRRFRYWRLLLKPPVKFIELYLLKRGFLDGTAGFIIAMASACSTFLKEAKLYEMDKLARPAPSNLPTHYRNKT